MGNKFFPAEEFVSEERMAQLSAARKANKVPIDLAADAAGVSSGHQWRCETGVARLTHLQAKRLEDFIVRTIKDRIETTIKNLSPANAVGGEQTISAGAEAPSLAEEGRETCRQGKRS